MAGVRKAKGKKMMEQASQASDRTRKGRNKVEKIPQHDRKKKGGNKPGGLGKSTPA